MYLLYRPKNGKSTIKKEGNNPSYLLLAFSMESRAKDFMCLRFSSFTTCLFISSRWAIIEISSMFFTNSLIKVAPSVCPAAHSFLTMGSSISLLQDHLWHNQVYYVSRIVL